MAGGMASCAQAHLSLCTSHVCATECMHEPARLWLAHVKMQASSCLWRESGPGPPIGNSQSEHGLAMQAARAGRQQGHADVHGRSEAHLKAVGVEPMVRAAVAIVHVLIREVSSTQDGGILSSLTTPPAARPHGSVVCTRNILWRYAH